MPPTGDFEQTSYREEPVKITLAGSRQGVHRMIHLLHRANIIAGSDWSRLIPIKNSNEAMTVASRCKPIIQQSWVESKFGKPKDTA